MNKVFPRGDSLLFFPASPACCLITLTLFNINALFLPIQKKKNVPNANDRGDS